MKRLRATDILSRDEIASLTQTSDLRGAAAVLACWVGIAATFAVLARYPHPAVFALAVVVLRGRQLALTVLAHEAAHRTLFRTRWLNDALTDVACARPVGIHIARYRKHHVGHHAHTGTERDPDRGLAAPFPVSRASLERKLGRDVLFVSGARRAIGLVLMDLEILEYSVAGT